MELKLKKIFLSDIDFKLVSIGTGTLSGKEEALTRKKNSLFKICCWEQLPKGNGVIHVVARLLIGDVFDFRKNSRNVHYEVQEKFEDLGQGSHYQRVNFQFLVIN